jgi:hypothetical protein
MDACTILLIMQKYKQRIKAYENSHIPKPIALAESSTDT